MNISQQAAYNNLRKLRKHLAEPHFKDSEILYIDEKFFGSKAKTQHKQKVNSDDYLKTRENSGIKRSRRKNMQKKKKLTIGIASNNGKYFAEYSGVLTESKSSLLSDKYSLAQYNFALLSLFLRKLKNNLVVITDGDRLINKALKNACIIKNINIKILTVNHGRHEYVKLSKDKSKIISTNRIEGF